MPINLSHPLLIQTYSEARYSLRNKTDLGPYQLEATSYSKASCDF